MLAPKLKGALFQGSSSKIFVKNTKDESITEDDDTHVSWSSNNGLQPCDISMDDQSFNKTHSVDANDTTTGSNLFLPKGYTTFLRISPLKKPPRLLSFLSQSAIVNKVKYLSIHTVSSTELDGISNEEPQGYIQYYRHCRLRGGNSNNKVFQLLDENQEPVALCLPDSSRHLVDDEREPHTASFNAAYVFYCRRPISTECINHDVDAVQHDGATFYPWLRVVIPDDTQSKGVVSQPTFQVWDHGNFHAVSCLPESVVSKNFNCDFDLDYDQKDVDDDDTVDARNGGTMESSSSARVLTIAQDGKASLSASAMSFSQSWNVSVHAGADPAMMLCLTTVLGKLIS